MSEDPVRGSASREQQLLLAFVGMADTLVDDFDVVEVLHQLSDHCVSLLGAAAAGMLLSDQHGGLQVIAASSERSRLLELLELQADEGPCVDAYRTGALVQADDLAVEAERWPVFAPEALAEGFRSVQAVPLRLRRRVIGALNLFGPGPGFGTQNPEIVQALADTATIGILQERVMRREETLTEQLQRALNSRVVIEQAKGFLSHIGNVPMDEAFQHLRGYSRDHGRRLSDVAGDITRHRLDAQDVLDGH